MISAQLGTVARPRLFFTGRRVGGGSGAGSSVAAGADSSDSSLVPLLRGQCNYLALRVTHAAVALYKGNALLVSHPAQRLAREAMFLLVWSCPDPVIDCTVDLLAE